MTTLEAQIQWGSAFPSNQLGVESAATLWTLYITTMVTALLLGTESSQGLKGWEGPWAHKKQSGGRSRRGKKQIRTTFQSPISKGKYVSHHVNERKGKTFKIAQEPVKE